jgi:hypothetical protein
MPGLENEFEVQALEHDLYSWHADWFHHPHRTPKNFIAISNIFTATGYPTPKTLATHIDFNHCFAALLPVRFPTPTPWKMQRQFLLGSVITQRRELYNDFLAVSYIPHFLIRPGLCSKNGT